MTCRVALVVAWFTLFVGVGAQEGAVSPRAILSQAREALGGDKRLGAIRTFVATGRTRQVRGDHLVPIEFEIACELPDKYARRDEFPVQDAGPTTIGFNGHVLIQLPPLPLMPARSGGPPPPTAAQGEVARNARVASLKQDFARWVLGMFADSFSGLPLAFAYAGTAEAPQGQADVLDVTGPADFSARFFVHKTTHVPIMVSWRAAPVEPPGGGPPPSGAVRGVAPPRVPLSGPALGTPGQAASPRATGAQNAMETRLYFGDYREVDGVLWPFRLRRAVGADTIEETTFDRFRINPRIDPKKFESK